MSSVSVSPSAPPQARDTQTAATGKQQSSAAAANNGPGRRAPSKNRAGWGTRLFASLALLALVVGWINRDALDLTAESGLGYVLGITGGSLMLSLLLYPARKNWRLMAHWGPLKHWFQVHMMFGVIGPILILYHARFHFGSINSNVALFCMLVVAGSGVVGRFFYSRIHHGLYGHRASLEELHEQLEVRKGRLGEQFTLSTRNTKRLHRLERFARQGKGPLHAIRVLLLPWMAGWTRRRVVGELRRDIRRQARAKKWTRPMRRELEAAARGNVSIYITTVIREAQFSFYERMFSLWHVVHIPLFFMLLIAGIAHVIAVHMY